MPEPLPLAEFVRLIHRTSRLRGHAAILLSAGGILLVWRIEFMPLTPPGRMIVWLPDTVYSIALNLALLRALARIFARKPRFHTREATEHNGAVREWSARLKVPAPRLLVSRSRYLPPVGLRGWPGDVAIVITTRTLVRWNKSPAARTVHLAHELAHVWARDLRFYYWTRSLSTLSVAALLITASAFARNGDATGDVATFLLKILILAFLTLVVSRAYLRFREHVADLTAMLATDDSASVNAELAQVKDQTILGQLIGTHPGREARLTVLSNPMHLFRSERWWFLLLGVAGGFFTSATTYFLLPVVRGADLAHQSAPWIAAALSAALLAISVPMTIIELLIAWDRSANRAIRDTLTHSFLLFLGLSVGLLFLSPTQLIPSKVVSPVSWILAGGVAYAAAVVTTIGCLILIATATEGRPTARGSVVFRMLVFGSVLATLFATSRLFNP